MTTEGELIQRLSAHKRRDQATREFVERLQESLGIEAKTGEDILVEVQTLVRQFEPMKRFITKVANHSWENEFRDEAQNILDDHFEDLTKNEEQCTECLSALVKINEQAVEHLNRGDHISVDCPGHPDYKKEFQPLVRHIEDKRCKECVELLGDADGDRAQHANDFLEHGGHFEDCPKRIKS